MASKSLTLAEISRDFFTCAICLEVYIKPKQLPCLHTFCLKCLEGHIHKSATGNNINCPICQRDTDIPNGSANDFKDNFFVSSLCEVLPPPESTQIFCDICLSNVPATQVCIQCVERLCQQCTEHHQRSKYTHNHKTVTVEEFRSGDYMKELRTNQKSFCPIHTKKELELFCSQCKIPVCLLCTKLHHDNHKMTAMHEASETVNKELCEQIENLRPKIKILQQTIDMQNKISEDIEENSEEVVSDIDNWSKQQCTKIMVTKAKLTNEVQTLARSAKKEKNGVLDAIQHQLAAVESTIAYGERITTFATDTEKLQVHVDLKQTLQELQRQNLDVDSSKPLFRFKPALIMEYGTVEMSKSKDNVWEKRILGDLQPNILEKAKLVHSFNTQIGKGFYKRIAIDKNKQIFVTNPFQAGVHVYNRQGLKQFVFGHTGQNRATNPNDINIDHDGNITVACNKNVYICDANYHLQHVLKDVWSDFGHSVTHNNEILVSDYGQGVIKVFDFNRKLKRQIDKKTIGLNLFRPWVITVNQKNEIIVGNLATVTVCILDELGNKLHTYQPTGKLISIITDYGFGLCTDQWGHIIVADIANRLHLLSSTGQHLGLLVTADDGLVQPHDVTISGPGELAVIQDNGEVKFYKYLDI